MSKHQGGTFVQVSSSLPSPGSKVKAMGDQRDDKSLGSKSGGKQDKGPGTDLVGRYRTENLI